MSEGSGEKMRILHVVSALEIGGSMALLLNLHKKINTDLVQFDYVSLHRGGQYDVLADSVKALGGKIYYLPTLTGFNLLKVIKSWIQFFKNHPEYKIIHSHLRSYAALYLLIAKHFGLKTIIHSHNTKNDRGMGAVIKTVLQYPLRFVADYFLACSNEAGLWLFGKNVVKSPNYHVLKNAIDTTLFKFNQNTREEYRKKLNIPDSTKVFINVGRFVDQKNHDFLLRLFAEITKENNNTLLLLVGDGELRPQIESQIDMLKINNSVILLGAVQDVYNWFQVADTFLFPSLWEGLGIVAIEAQTAGLPCICSNYVPKEAAITENCSFLPLEISFWKEEALKSVNIPRKDCISQARNAGYDAIDSANWLTKLYMDIQSSKLEESC